MPEELRHIAARIRELREILDMTPETVANLLGIPLETYLGHEAGTLDIPISTLYQLSGIFGVDFTVLLTGSMPHMDTYSLVRAGDGITIDRYSGYRYQDLAFNYKGRTMEPMVVSLQEERNISKLVHHTGQEFNYVLEGHVRVVIGKHDFILHPGDSIYFDPTLPHGQFAVDGPARFLTVIQE